MRQKLEIYKMKTLTITMSVCIVVIGLCSVPFILNDWFFEQHTTIADKLKYVGAFVGGILVAINAYFIYKRTKELNRSNYLVAKGQLDTRFKDAASLLAEGNTSAELSGIHALHQIAVEASKTKDQKDYVKVIKDILIAFIKENSVIKYKEDENGEKLLDEFENPIVEKVHNNEKNKIVLQTIIDKLFKKDNDCEIYDEYSITLSKTVLKGKNFYGAQLQNVRFREAQLQNANFGYTQLQNTDFCGAQLQNINFKKAYSIDKAIFDNTSWNKNTNFESTAFENKTIEELTEIMGCPPTPIG